MSDAYPVEVPRSFAEFSACAELQLAVDPPVERPIPAWILWELVQAGAVLLVGFDGVGIAREPLGFALALPGDRGLRVVAYGVRRDLPERTEVLETIVEELLGKARTGEVLWPFDPLEPSWAEFFLERLGAEAHTYELRRDQGGAVEYFRALARLSPETGRREKRWKEAALKSFFPVNSTRLGPGGAREPRSWNRHLTAPRLVLEVPGEGRSSLPKDAAVRWAEAWEVLEEYMDRGYALVGLYRQRDRAFLVLERGS